MIHRIEYLLLLILYRNTKLTAYYGLKFLIPRTLNLLLFTIENLAVSINYGAALSIRIMEDIRVCL